MQRLFITGAFEDQFDFDVDLEDAQCDEPSTRASDLEAASPHRRATEHIQESERPRRSAVDEEILRYGGALAKRDPEGFIYPSVTSIAKKISRTRYYVQQRILYLQRIGRLVPAQRTRHGRSVSGWLVLRYHDWLRSQQSDPSSPGDAPNSLNLNANKFDNRPNCLAIKRSQNAPKSSSCKRDPDASGKGSIGLPEYSNTVYEKSQSTVTATAQGYTDGLDSNPSPSKKSPRGLTPSPSSTFEERLIAKIHKTKKTLKQAITECDPKYKDDFDYWLGAAKEACDFLGYSLDLDSRLITEDFCNALVETWSDYQGKLEDGSLPPSSFCSKVIDACREDDNTLWPPDFTQHRNRLREAEKSDRLRVYVVKTSDGGRRRTGVVDGSF